MSEKAYTLDKNQKGFFLWVFMLLLWAFVCFYISGVFCLSVAHLMQEGISKVTINQIGDFILRLFNEPLFLFTAYAEWWRVFSLAFRFSQLKAASFVPIIPPLLFCIIVYGSYVKSAYSFVLWYRLNNRYAKLEDVKMMGILSGFLMVLGKFQGNVLRLKKALSVFVWGAPGLGKTTAVAIPSILESDKVNIVSVECSGALAKYTSGYRSQLGNVFYFNWGLTDNPVKGEYWPRWNPLSEKEMPAKGEERDKYLSGIAQYLLPKQKDNYWEKMACAAMEGLLQFYSSKIDQACANDYFLSELLDKGKLSPEDKDVLLSYYALMPRKYTESAINHLNEGTLNIDNYLPIGSWNNVPAVWQGKEFCLSMFADCLIQRYFMIMQNDDPEKVGGWKILLGELLNEAAFFGYNSRALQVMQHLYYLSRKQRKIIFTLMLAPLSVFRKNSVRERTSLSDISLNQVRGMVSRDGKLRPVTLYTVADSRSSAFMVKFFVDMLIEKNLRESENKEAPLLFVMDDFERLPKFSRLSEGLTYGPSRNMSFLLLTDGLKNIQNNYGVEGLEEIISATSYKLMFAENNQRLGEHFNKLAVYGTKSVQIPSVDTGAFYKVRKGLADANYYHRIAQGLLSRSRFSEVKKGQHLLLAEGFYHLPIKVSSMFFLKDERLKEKAAMDSCYLLDENIVGSRNSQDVEIPQLLDVLKEAGVSVNKEEDVDNYLEDRYDEMVENMQETPDEQSAMADDISSRWQAYQKKELREITPGKDGDWWLEEDSFSVSDSSSENPFDK